jgi:hypothetical protein
VSDHWQAGRDGIEQRLRGHTLRFSPNGLFHFIIEGDITADDARAITAFTREHAAGRTYVLLLADLGALGSISHEARRIGVHAEKRVPYRAIAVYRASFEKRILASLILRAMALFKRLEDNPVQFFATEAEARAWIAERFRCLAAGG